MLYNRETDIIQLCACAPTLVRHHHFLVEMKRVMCKLHRAQCHCGAPAGFETAAAYYGFIQPHSWIYQSHVSAASSLPAITPGWYGKDPHGFSGPSQSTTPS